MPNTTCPIAARLRTVTSVLSISRNALAEACGVAPCTISRARGGHSAPSIDLMVTLQELWDVNINWLLTGKGHMLTTSVGEPDLEGAVIAALPRGEASQEVAERLERSLVQLEEGAQLCTWSEVVQVNTGILEVTFKIAGVR